MATAKVEVISLELICPSCGETIPEKESGSLFWTLMELPHDGTVVCGCGKKLKVPKQYR